MRGPPKQHVSWRDVDDLAAKHGDDSIRDLGDNREVVTDQQHGKIALFGQFVGQPPALLVIAPLMGAALFGSAVANWLTIAYAFPPHLRATGYFGEVDHPPPGRVALQDDAELHEDPS